jgi:hypothetical protein
MTIRCGFCSALPWTLVLQISYRNEIAGDRDKREGGARSKANHIPSPVDARQPNTRDYHHEAIDITTKTKALPERELTEEQFFEQFAALEEGLALVQINRGLSENAAFRRLVRHMRRSICYDLSPRQDAHRCRHAPRNP